MDVGGGQGAGEALVAVGCTDGSIWVFGSNTNSGRSGSLAGALSPSQGMTRVAGAGAGAEAGVPPQGLPSRLLWEGRAPLGAAVSHVTQCPTCPSLLASAHEDGTVALHSVQSMPSVPSAAAEQQAQQDVSGTPYPARDGQAGGLDQLAGQHAGHAGPAAALCYAQLDCQITALSWHPSQQERLAASLANSTVLVGLPAVAGLQCVRRSSECLPLSTTSHLLNCPRSLLKSLAVDKGESSSRSIHTGHPHWASTLDIHTGHPHMQMIPDLPATDPCQSPIPLLMPLRTGCLVQGVATKLVLYSAVAARELIFD